MSRFDYAALAAGALLAAALLLAGCDFDGPNPFPKPNLKETALDNRPQPQLRSPCGGPIYVACKKR